MKIAVTGATGFLGGHVLAALLDAGHDVRALTRGPQPDRAPNRSNVEWVAGALDDQVSTLRLVQGADAVVHIAGVVNAPTAAAFDVGNRIGTEAILASTHAVAPAARFVHVSSLAAREPQLSNYGASKRAAEEAVLAAPLDWRVVRPPAIYGPGDTDNLELFRFARLGVIPLPPPGRLSVIHAHDLARLIVALVAGEATNVSYDADDGIPGGWSHADYARAIGRAMDKHVVTLPLPPSLVRLGSKIDRLVRADRAKLTADRAAYMCHSDWTIDPARRPLPELWTPRIATEAGLAATAAWYRAAGWL